MKAYGDPTSTDVGGTYYYRNETVNPSTGAGIDGGIFPTTDGLQLRGANKAEVDCMLCHMNGMQNGAAWYKSIGCGTDPMVAGPADNINCNGFYDVPFQPGVDGPNPDPRFAIIPGTIYDSFNRNIAVTYGYLAQAATAGIGAQINLQTGALSNVPLQIPGASIAYVPNSENCAQCHARTNFDTMGRLAIGLPMEAESYGGMTTGFGNFFRVNPAGSAFDWDKIDVAGACTDCSNDTMWVEFGCKTGMGKRSQRSGQGSQDRFGFGICMGCATFNAMMGNPTGNPYGGEWFMGGVCGMPSVQASCNAKAGTTLQGATGQWMGIFENPMTQMPAKIAGKMADIDVHDAVGVKCATCHSKLSGDFAGRTVSSGATSYTYPGITGVQRADHQMAQGWSTLEKANDEFDGTVTCEGCHIDRTHPNWDAIPGHPAPVPTHATLPALHLDKIDCRTCHIAKVYSAPGRLLFRDWTAGAYRQGEGANGNANHFDFAYDFMDGGAVPMIPMKQWIKVQKPSGDELKIAPGLPSMLPLWMGQRNTAGVPAKTRDVTAAAALVAKQNPSFGIRMNGANDHPPFQGFQLADPWKIDSAAKITAMRAELMGTGSGFATHDPIANPRMNLMPFFFDPSHGILGKEDALGAPSKGGCTMCHSTSQVNMMTGQPIDPVTYRPESVGFFDGTKNMAKNGMMQMADYDCGGTDAEYGMGVPGPAGWSNAAHPDWMCGMFDATAMGGDMDGTCDAGELMQCRMFIAGNLFPMFGMPADIANAFPVDGIQMMQLMAIREGAATHMPQGCDTRMKFFGIPDGQGPGTNGCLATDFYSRGEIRAYFKKNLQQVIVGGERKVFGNMKVGPTFATYDIGSTCYNPMDGSTFPCMDGGYINTTVSERQMLGYSQAQFDNLVSLFVAGAPVTETQPQARFSSRMTGMVATLDGRSSLNADTFAWTCAGGVLSSPTASVTTCDFTAAGTGNYSVNLTVTNLSTSETDTKTLVLNVAAPNNAPVATGTCSNNGFTVGITDTSTDADGNPLTLFVNWGDGSGEYLPAAGATVTHIYSAGTYTPYLTASDHRGGTTSVAPCGMVNIGSYLGTVTGTVATPSATPLANAVITLYNGATAIAAGYTNASGVYTLVNVPFGSGYYVSTKLNGYIFANVTGVNVLNTTAVDVDVTSGASTINGTIANSPAQGIAVELRNAAGVTVGATICNAAGAYTFTGIANGTYTIVPQLGSGSTTPATVDVTIDTDPETETAAAMTYAP